MNIWISTEIGLPNDKVTVNFLTDKGEIIKGRREGRKWFQYIDEYSMLLREDKVTHWEPLLEQPQPAANDGNRGEIG